MQYIAPIMNALCDVLAWGSLGTKVVSLQVEGAGEAEWEQGDPGYGVRLDQVSFTYPS